MHTPDNIIFDFGGVVVDIDVASFIERLSRMGVDSVRVRDIHPDNTGLFLLYEKGLVSSKYFLSEFRHMFPDGENLSDSFLSELWNSIILPYDYSRFEVLRGLRAAGHKLFLLSNTNEIHHRYFESLFDRENPFGKKFRDFFDCVYYSDEMKMRKPDAEIYERVLEEQHLKAEDTLFIDDNEVNLAAPKRMGMQVYHFTAGNDLAAVFGMR